jgi:hypothetical protein
VGGIAEYIANVSVSDTEGPGWAFGGVIKPYRRQVTLIAQNNLPGVDISFANAPFSAEIQDPRIIGIPPFNSKIILKFAPNTNTTLAYGPHYITIKGVGQDGTERTCTCVLMVGRSCEKNRFISINGSINLSNTHIFVNNISCSDCTTPAIRFQ